MSDNIIEHPIDPATTAAVQDGAVVLPHTGAGISVSSLEKMDLTETIPAKQFKLDRAAIEVIRELKCPGATTTEVMWFLYQCSALGLNPLMPGQISFEAYTKDGERRRLILIEIGGHRNLAARTGRYRQGNPPILEYDEKTGKPLACTVSLYEKFEDEWILRSRRFLWSEFSAFHAKKMWQSMSSTMFAKAAEAALIRFYFFDATSGVYTPEEIEGPDVAGLLEQKLAERGKGGERAMELLGIAARKFKVLDVPKPKDAAIELAKKTVPGKDPKLYTEEDAALLAAAVDAIDTEKPAEKT